MQQKYFTSDTHFNHQNIIRYCARPFGSIEEMNAEIIRRCNEKVGKDDVLIHVGDFAMGKDWLENAKQILAQMNGYHIIVLGNHDRSPKKMMEVGFKEVHTSLSLDSQYGKIFLRHAPGIDHDPGPIPDGYSYFLHGHVHNRWKKQDRLINVGVDVWNFYPQTLEELISS